MPPTLRSPLRSAIPHISLRWVLVIPVVVQTVGAVLLVGYLSYRSGQQATANLANQLLQQTSERVCDRLDHYLHTPQQLVAANYLEVQQGTLNLDDPEQLRQQFWQQMLLNPSLPGNGFWSEDGTSIGYTRISSSAFKAAVEQVSGQPIPFGTILFHEIQPQHRRYFGVDAQGRPSRLLYQSYDDFRSTPWYLHARTADRPGWVPVTLARIVPLLQTFAIAPVDDATGTLQGVFAAHYALTEISLFLHQLQFSPTGQVFILERSGDLIATSAPLEATAIREVNDQISRLPAIASQDQVTRSIAQQLSQQLGGFDNLQQAQQLKLALEDQRGFVQITPYRSDFGLDWLLVTVIPEADFMADIQRNIRTTALLCLLTLGGSMAAGLAIAHRLTTRIAQLNRASQTVATGDLIPQLPTDSSIVEVRGLAQAFNQMAEQLHQLFQTKVEAEALRQSDLHLKRLAAAVPGMIYTYTQHADGSHGFEYASAICRDILELEPEQVTGNVNAVLDQIHPEDRPAHDAAVAHSKATLEPFSLTFRNITPSGQLKWLEASSRPLHHDNGHITWYGILLDISDRKQAEMALGQSERKFATVFRDIPQAAWIATLAEGRCLDVNEGFSRVLGYSHADAVGKSCVDMQLWNDLQDLHLFRKTLLETGQIHDFEVVFRTQSKQAKTVLISAQVSRLDDQDCVIGTLNDISDRKQAELSLQQALQSLNHHVDHSPLATIRWNREFRVEIWSEQAENIFGWAAAEVIGKTMFDWQFIHRDDGEKVRQCAIELLQGETKICHNRNYHKDGSTVYCEWYNSVLFDEQGNLVSILSLVQDVSDRHHSEADRQQAEAALRESEERLRVALEAAHMGSWDWNIVTQQIIWSESLERLMGLQPGTFDGRFETIVAMLYPDDRQRVLEAITRSVEQGENYEMEFRFVKSDGSIRWALSKGTILHDAAGRAVRMVGVDVDITNRKRTEQELQQAKDAAETANQAKSTFLANMSHELRTPLNVILGFTQLMKRDPTLSSESQDYVNVIASNGHHLLQLINEILDLSKIEAGKLTIENQATNLSDLLHGLHNMFWQQASHKGLKLYLDIQAGVPQMILADTQKLQQVLINLLSNAIKFTPQGQVTLRVQPTEGWAMRDQDPSMASHDFPTPTLLCFAVEDTGLGISAPDLDIIFESFGQTPLGRQTQEGTGLGLAISRKLVQLMGGDITVTSQLGQGSTFQFTLPAQAMPTATIQPGQLDRQVTGLTSDQPHYRLLVVDDQADNRLVLVKLFQQLGLEVQEANTGEEAIAQWQDWHPHLIWMDLRMPGLDGYDATRKIRALETQQRDRWETPTLHPTVIIALTAQASMDDRALAIAAGCDDYISKPFQVDTLLDKMMTYLGLSYIYADVDRELTHAYGPSSQRTLTATDFSVMPSAWIAQLHAMSQSCDEQAVLALIKQIPPEHNTLVTGLHHLIHNFDFHAIVEMTTLLTANAEG